VGGALNIEKGISSQNHHSSKENATLKISQGISMSQVECFSSESVFHQENLTRDLSNNKKDMIVPGVGGFKGELLFRFFSRELDTTEEISHL